MNSKSGVSDANNLSTLLEDTELVAEKLAHQEVQLVKEAEELFKKQVEHIMAIDKMQSSVPNMEKIDVDAKKLSSLVDSSSVLVEDVCSKVGRIDLAKTRLQDCLKKVGDILDLGTCQFGMAQAMDAQNYEEAAMHIKRYLSIDQNELQRTVSLICGGKPIATCQSEKKESLFTNLDEGKIDSNKTYSGHDNLLSPKHMNSALVELDKARERLLLLCQTKMNTAIEEHNAKDIERFFKIFPMLNEHHDGLKRYANHLQSRMVDVKLDETFKSRQINQADKLAALYESIAKLIDSHQPLIETYYGPGHLIIVVRVVQRECDRLSRKILEEFRNETKLQYVAKIVRNSSAQSLLQSAIVQVQNQATNLNPPKLDPRDVDSILNQMSLIVSRSEVYLDFIVGRIKEDIISKSEDASQRQTYMLELYNLVCNECELNHLIQEVGGIYVMLEQFYLNESSKKAILMDQIDIESKSCFISSMLDDIFFIIKKCTKRAISTKSIEVFCAIINHCVTLLESTFCQVLEERLVNQQYYSTAFTAKNLDLSQAYSAIQSSRYLQSASELEIAKSQFFSALNNLDKACEYIQTLREILDLDIKKLKPSLLLVEQQQANQMQKSVTCLNELSKLVDKFSSISKSSLIQLFNASLRNRARTELKTIIDENPDLPNLLKNSPGEVRGLAKDLLETLDRSLQESLTSENYLKLVSITRDYLASSLKIFN